MLLFLLLSIGFAIAQNCEPGWSYFNGNCYKHIVESERRIGRGGLWAQCYFRSAHLTSIASAAEQTFVAALASRSGNWLSKVDAMEQDIDPSLVVGYHKGQRSLTDYVSVGGYYLNGWIWPHTKSTWYNWCNIPGLPKEPTGPGADENCVVMQVDRPCVYDVRCDGNYGGVAGYSRYVCKKPSS